MDKDEMFDRLELQYTFITTQLNFLCERYKELSHKVDRLFDRVSGIELSTSNRIKEFEDLWNKRLFRLSLILIALFGGLLLTILGIKVPPLPLSLYSHGFFLC